jgi:hypothetical protein
MEIKNLSSTNLEMIFSCFCEVFLNYFIAFPPLFEETTLRWKNAGVDFSLSYGVFDKNRLVAILLNAQTKNVIHHFAMGVIPEYRGRHLISKMLEQIPREVEYFRLEVITDNHRAIKLYENLGYKVTRRLYCYEGVLKLPTLKPAASYHVLPYRGEKYLSLQLYKPSCEADNFLYASGMLCETHILKDHQEVIAYAHYAPSTLSILEIGSKGVLELDWLMKSMKLENQKIYLMNIDSDSGFLPTYFLERGLKCSIQQFEMQLMVVR